MPKLVEPRPKKGRSGKIIFLLLVFFLILLAVLFFRSELSKVDRIEIGGYRYTTAEQIEQALGLKAGDPFFSVTKATLSSRIEELPYVEKAIVDKHFPGYVGVEVIEFPEIAYSLGTGGQIEAILANAANVQLIPGESLRYLPVLSGWEDRAKELDALCKALSQIPAPLLADISQIKPDPTVSYPDRIRMYTRSYFEVVTTIAYLPNKLDYMRAIIYEYEPGIITMLEANSHTSYQALEAEEADNGADSETTDG